MMVCESNLYNRIVQVLCALMWLGSLMLFEFQSAPSCGFGIDNEGRLYLGMNQSIHVYDGNELIGHVFPRTSRGYQFTIIDGEYIYLSTGSFVYTMDLQGNVIKKSEDEGTRVYNQLKRTNRTFSDVYGRSFRIESSWGRMQIVSNNEIIYQMPLESYIAKCGFMACYSGCALIALAYHWIKYRPKRSINCRLERNMFGVYIKKEWFTEKK